jgi:hypothetical protein
MWILLRTRGQQEELSAGARVAHGAAEGEGAQQKSDRTISTPLGARA